MNHGRAFLNDAKTEEKKRQRGRIDVFRFPKPADESRGQ